jgi:N-acetylmuramoyl-L-alanine amidase
MMTKAIRTIPFILLILGALFTNEANALNGILNIRHWVAPDHTRIVIDTSKTPEYTLEKNRDHIRIDFKNTSFSKDIPQKTVLNKPGVEVISVTNLAGDGVRVEISLAQHRDTHIFNLSKMEEKPDRVVVDIELPIPERMEADQQIQVQERRKKRIIVIDPGHGGEDPGAIGPRGTREKDIVLKISRMLRNKLNKREGYRAYLTRDGDYYLSFSRRLRTAREYGADLFLSIHADAAPNRQAHGASVYCLSISGASTEAARLLAVKENLADMVGGSPNGEGNDASGPIVLNMYQTNTINTSKIYGQGILENIAHVIPLKFETVQSAPFRVLKLPEIPSLLVETGYISNRNEERLLSSRSYQDRITDAIVNAVVGMLPVEPVEKTAPVVEVVKEKIKSSQASAAMDRPVSRTKQMIVAPEAPGRSEDIREYQVKRGDTLAKIAQKHGTTLNALLKLNRMKLKDPLFAGRTIIITGTAVERAIGEPVTRDYRVKRGDTLAAIAQKHGTTLNALLKLNLMKLRDPLFAGRVIKIRDDSDDKKTATALKPDVSDRTGKERFTYYRVKRGETLGLIANKKGVTIDQLRELNRMKPSDPLLADQRLKLPLPSSL